MSASDAMQKYINTIDRLPKDSGIIGGPVGDGSESLVLVENKSCVCWIRFSRPKKYNAITTEMCEHSIKALQNATNDGSIKLAFIMAKGNHYSSGYDLSESLFLWLRFIVQ
jgi:hypothetical protein